MLKIGTAAPTLKLPSTEDRTFELSKDLAQKPAIVYFYPKDFTNVCTAEACSFRDEFEAFRELDVAVVGVSMDSIATHKRFKNQFKLPFELLSDSNLKAAKAWKAVTPLVPIPRRVTYLLDKDHMILASISDMFNGQKHVKEMMEKIAKAGA